MDSSICEGAAIIRSASSSMMITTCGSTLSCSSLAVTDSLYASRSLTPSSANFLYLSVISATAQLRAAAALDGSVTTGIIRCGNAVVIAELHHLWIDENQLDFIGPGLVEQADDDAVDAD